MTFQHPWLLSLCIPAFIWLWHSHPDRSTVFYLRLMSLFLMLLGLSNPTTLFQMSGQDFIVVVDQSDSMPLTQVAFAEETIQDLESRLNPGDRLGIISVGAEVRIDKQLIQNGRQQIYPIQKTDASKLSTALDTALKQIPPERKGQIILISDGGNTDRPWLAEVRTAIVRQIPIHTLAATQQSSQDIQIVSMDAPSEISKGEGVQIEATVHSPFDGDVTVELMHQGKLVASGSKQVQRGNNRITFRDLPDTGGIHEYTIRIRHPEDSVVENNTATVGTLVQGPKTVLVLSETPSPITKILREQNTLVIERHPELPIRLPLLTQVNAIVLHNVPATYFSESELNLFRIAVEQLGKGLWMVGGQGSFGVGGYLNTALEDILPVSLEIREEKRKVGMALGIALDRSGSMGMPMGPNLTKMDLANQGAASALGLLTQMDSIVVNAVDTETHEIVPLQPVNDPNTLIESVLGIESAGGGIYVDTALKDLHQALLNAPQKNKRIILFADASDAENDGDAIQTVGLLQQDNIAVSVIALGTPGDSDAKFLLEIATKGGGSIYFTESPKELPKLFSMETMVASQSGFIEELTPVTTITGLSRFGAGLPALPRLQGYNVVFPKSGAVTGYQTQEEDPSPILAVTQAGLGQSVAYMGCIGGSCGQSFLQWRDARTFIRAIVNGIANAGEMTEGFVGVQQEGADFVYTVESKSGAPDIRVFSPSGTEQSLDFIQIEPNLYEGRLRTDDVGIHTAIQNTASGVSTLPPLSKSISTEFTSLNTLDNTVALRRLSDRTNGLVNPSLTQVFDNPAISQEQTSWRTWILSLLLPILLLEIMERRLKWLSSAIYRIRTKSSEATTPRPSKGTATTPSSKLAPSPDNSEVLVSADAVDVPKKNPEPPKKQDSLQDALQRAKTKR